jgi:hypothetical protein
MNTLFKIWLKILIKLRIVDGNEGHYVTQVQEQINLKNKK